jgi:hypothetical protein
MPAKMQKIKLKDYDDDWINRLAVICDRFDGMNDVERDAALRFVLARYKHRWAKLVDPGASVDNPKGERQRQHDRDRSDRCRGAYECSRNRCTHVRSCVVG